MASDVQGNNPFLKQLASSDKRTRDNALDSLRSYLRAQTSLSPLDLLKLHKGLFYCMWMSDRTRTQQQLARDLASLVDELKPALVIPFLDAFWKTISRQWGEIDSLRMDKFLYLVRCYLGAGFRFCARHQWARGEAIGEFLDVLRTTPLEAEDAKISNGLRYHVVDIYVDELEKVGAGKDDNVPVDRLLEPLEALGKASPTKAVRDRVKEALSDQRVREWRGEEVTDEDGEGEVEADGPKPAKGVVVGHKFITVDNDGDEWGGLDD